MTTAALEQVIATEVVEDTEDTRDEIPSSKKGEYLVLTKSDIKVLWDQKVINDGVYIALAMKFDGTENLNIPRFIARWSGELPNKKGEVKELKPKSITTTIAALEAAENLETTTQTIQLSLNF